MERKSRYTVLIKNPSRHSRPITGKIIKAFSALPAFARQSFTFDRGTEFAGFRALEEGIGAAVGFATQVRLGKKGPLIALRLAGGFHCIYGELDLLS